MHEPLPRPNATFGKRVVVRFSVMSLNRYRYFLARFASDLSEAELSRARRYRRSEDSDRFILGRICIRRLSATHLGIEPRAVTILQTPAGKPYLEPSPPTSGELLEFNLSHSGERLLLAWSIGLPVGVNVERVKTIRRRELLQMAATAFSPAELKIVISAAPSEAARIFYRIWVRKEATLKAEGVGLGFRAQSFSVANPTREGVEWFRTLVFPASRKTWSLIDLDLGQSHVASLAVSSVAEVEECKEIPGLGEIWTRRSGSNR